MPTRTETSSCPHSCGGRALGWPTFKDYLSKVKAYYYDQGRIGGTRGRVIHAYEEDYRQAYASSWLPTVSSSCVQMGLSA